MSYVKKTSFGNLWCHKNSNFDLSHPPLLERSWPLPCSQGIGFPKSNSVRHSGSAIQTPQVTEGVRGGRVWGAGSGGIKVTFGKGRGLLQEGGVRQVFWSAQLGHSKTTRLNIPQPFSSSWCGQCWSQANVYASIFDKVDSSVAMRDTTQHPHWISDSLTRNTMPRDRWPEKTNGILSVHETSNHRSDDVQKKISSFTRRSYKKKVIKIDLFLCERQHKKSTYIPIHAWISTIRSGTQYCHYHHWKIPTSWNSVLSPQTETRSSWKCFYFFCVCQWTCHCHRNFCTSENQELSFDAEKTRYEIREKICCFFDYHK